MSVLTPTLTYGSLALTSSPFAWEFGGEIGAPENASQVILSLLADGDIEVSDRSGNRTITLSILIEGANLDALADSEALLEAECRKSRNTLTINPGDGSAASTVFDTFRAQLTLVRDDDFEQANLRRYTLTMRALPFGRSVAEITIPALAASGSTTTNVDTGSATTNWTGTIGGVSATPAVVSGKVGVTSTALTGSVVSTLTRTAAITTSATKYLVVDWSFSTNGLYFGTLSATGDGTNLQRISEITLSTGVRRTVFYVVAASVTALTLRHTSTSKSDAVVRSLFVDNIDRTDVRPTISTARQSIRTVEVTGSARTQAMLSVESSGNALGDVDVYTFTDDGSGYTPPLRTFLTTSGTVTADASLISGARTLLTGAASEYLIPYGAVPRGPYLIRARLRGSTVGGTANLNLLRLIKVGSSAWALKSVPLIPVTVTTSWANFDLVREVLPIVDIGDPSQAFVYLTLSASGLDVDIDELWIYHLGIGQLTSVKCGVGAAVVGQSSRRLFIQSPTTDNPRPRVLRGHSADMSDAFYPKDTEITSWGDHEFNPPATSVFVVTSNVTSPDVSLRYYPRWHTHAGS